MYYKRFFNALAGRYSIEYCYTLEDMFPRPDGSDWAIDLVPELNEYIGLLFEYFDTNYWYRNNTGGKLWEYIWTKNRDHIAFITSKEWNNTNMEEAKPFWIDFYKIWKSTKGYYETIINLMEQNQDKLLAQLSSVTESENQFNDLPDQSGDYSTINYATNLTKTKIKTSSDAGTVLERLEEVRRRYNDYYEKWAREFDKLFISPLNFDKKINEEDESE